MTVNVTLGPIPFWQFTDNEGKYAKFGKLYTKNWNTRQPKPTYRDPNGLIPWPNPIPLDSVGRAREIFWEEDVGYYLELRDQNDVLIWSTDEPYIPGSGGGGNVTTQIEITNLFNNGQFDDFPVGEYAPLPTSIPVLAYGGWSFIKNGTNPEDSITFKKYTLDNTLVPASPIYFLNYIANEPGTSETIKDIVFTISNVRSLENETITVGINARSAISGTFAIQVFAVQHFGTGGSPSADVITNFTPINLTTTNQNYSATITVPTLVGKTLGTNGDDNFQIHFRLPTNNIGNIELTNAYLKRGSSAFNDYPYITTDQNTGVINALNLPSFIPPTDFPTDATTYPVEQAYNAIMLKPVDGVLQEAWLPTVPVGSGMFWLMPTAPDGWILAEGQSVPVGGAYNRLFQLWGTRFGFETNNIISNELDNDTMRILCESSGVASPASVGSSPYTITRASEGFVSGIDSPDSGPVGALITFQNLSNGAFSPPATTNTGMTLTVISTGSLSTQASWSILATAANTLTPGNSISYNTTAGAFYGYLVIDGVGVDPALPGRTGHPINLKSTDINTEVALKIYYAIIGVESSYITFTAASAVEPGQYIEVSIVGSTTYQLYARIDGSVGILPPGPNIIPVDFSATDSANEVAQAYFNIMNPLLFKIVDSRGYFPRFWDHGANRDPNASSRTSLFPGGLTGNTPGTYQSQSVQPHTHPFRAAQVTAIETTPGGGFNITETGESTTDTFENTGSETRPINLYFGLIIKY